jgi:hypothetical protein
MALLPLIPVVGSIRAADVPKVPVPASAYLPVIYRFADSLSERGRDTYGAEKTGLLLSALDRTTVTPLTNGAMISAGNPQHDQNLLRLFYTLSELSTRAKYRDNANTELKWLMESEATTALNLLTNRDASWDVMRDKLAVSRKSLFFKPSASWYRPWMLWEQCFTVAPEGAARIVTALANSAEVAQTFGARERGFYLRTLAVAYSRTTNHQFLRSLEAFIDQTAALEQQNDDTQSALSLAIDCAGAAQYVPEPLASRLREMASRNDMLFLGPAHNVKKNGGFFIDAHMGVGGAITKRWDDRSGTTARIAMMCVSRYENTGDIRYRDFIHAAADTYLESDPAKIEGVSPITLGHAISLELAAWRSTAQQKYLDRARYFGDWALKRFFDAPLPRASTKSNHYEALSGTDTLALALVELHLNILGITAVRCPANTIDR